MSRYFRASFVQLNADYATSRAATDTVRRGHEVVKVFLNGHAGRAEDVPVGRGLGEAVIASSTTVLCHTLAHAYAEARAAGTLGGRDEIIVSTAGHEANVGPWLRLASRGFRIVPWQAEPCPGARNEIVWRPNLDTLRRLVSPRTALVTMPQVSNIMGEVWDVKGAAAIAHAAGARLVVDGVAYAPHHAPDVADLGCDWYIYSTYKVFGPHAAAMFGRREAFEDLTGPNHEFVAKDNLPYKWELGGANHESAAGIAALADYASFLACLASHPTPAPTPAAPPADRATFERAFSVMEGIEIALQRQFLEFLGSRPGVRIVGPRATDASRVATIAFLSDRAAPAEISARLAARGFGIRQGHAYSKRLLDAAGIPAVARVSFAHYNSPEEVDRVCGALAEII
jgi:selenocysteine lyase/cysteine desulfurase